MIKILNVFGLMNRGGAETGAMQALRRMDKSKFQYDFLVLKKGTGHFDSEILSHGSKIIYLEGVKNPFKFYRNFKQILKVYGPYQIIHSRVHHFSGIVLLYAKLLGIPVRIAHSHSDLPESKDTITVLRRIYYLITELLINGFSTVGLAVSRIAAKSLFGQKWKTESRFQVLYTGIDLKPYEKSQKNLLTKKSFGIPENSIIIGHVGSFRKAKNHQFLINIFYKLHAKHPQYHLLLCGDGPLKTDIQQMVEKLNINTNIHFLGIRDDIPDLMMHIMDIFVLPSIYEGLPHVGIEAQAAGLHCIFSETITREVQVNGQLVCFLPIEHSVEIWVDTILDIVESNNIIHQPDAYKKIKNSQFDINIGVQRLSALYTKLYEDSIRTRS